MNTITLQQLQATTRLTDAGTLQQMMTTLVDEALKGSLTVSNSLSSSINKAIQSIDNIITKQIISLLHQPSLQKLEGSWRGLHQLIRKSETNASLQIRLLSMTKPEIECDFQQANDFDQSHLFKLIYENAYGTPGGQPYSILLGDYEFSHQPRDLDLLKSIADISAQAFCPFISAANPHLFGLDQWTQLPLPRDLSQIFQSDDYIAWRTFRGSEASRFVSLTLPRVLARTPYTTDHTNALGFEFNETAEHHTDYCWMNAAYKLAECITTAFRRYGWCTAIRGAEGGGKVNGLPYTVEQASTEVSISDRREAELSQLGCLPLCHYRHTDAAVFFGGESVHQSKHYDDPKATANAAIAARLPYLLASSRFTHYLKVMARDKIGSFLEADELEDWLNHWILKYVNGNARSKQTLKAKYPLAEAKVKVTQNEKAPGSYQAIVWLRPWLQMEELTCSMRLVADLPDPN